MPRRGAGENLGHNDRGSKANRARMGGALSGHDGEIASEASAETTLPGSQYFPIFVYLGGVPPLVIGDAPELVAKIRLLLKFAPMVDLVLPRTASLPHQFGDRVRCEILDDCKLEDGVPGDGVPGDGVPGDDASDYVQAIQQRIVGRPLVVIDTQDVAINAALSGYARSIGVPVNVPDQIPQCSFFLGSIVDRGSVTVAISTSGVAPLLGQNLRARIEDMLSPKIDVLAHYLHGLRDQLRHLPPVMRRALQHQMINGKVARLVQVGRKSEADRAVLDLLQAHSDHPTAGTVTVVEAGPGETGLLSMDAANAIRSADSIFYDPQVSVDILDLARREADQWPFRSNRLSGLMRAVRLAIAEGKTVICLVGGDPAIIRGEARLPRAFHQEDVPFDYIVSASPVAEVAPRVGASNTDSQRGQSDVGVTQTGTIVPWPASVC